jgi:hypothetical protein
MSQRLYPPARPQSIGAILDTAFQIFGASLLRVLPYGILLGLSARLADLYNLATGRAVGRGAPHDLRWWVTYTLGVVVQMLLWAALLQRQRAVAQGEASTMRAELALSLRRLPAMVGMAVLILLAVAGGTLCLVLPGVYLAVALVMAQPTLILEGRGPIEAMRLSVQLVRGSWWRTFLIYLVAVVIVFVFYVLVIVILGILYQFMRRADVAFVGATAVVLISALSVFSFPFIGATTLAMFGDLHVRRALRTPPQA